MTTARRLDRRGGARGYTLVETAIVLTAFLLVAGGMVYPLSNTWSEQTYRSEEEYLRTVHDRIISYAARNRNRSHSLAFSGANIIPATVTVPGGRPYLPCPDLDGDGLEDRILKLATDGRINVRVVEAVNSGITTYVAGLDFEPGRCVDDKGLLPYRTLGIRSKDQWGSNFTYWVDGNFSNSALGFDQGTRASQMFKYAVAPIPGLAGASSGRVGRHYQYIQHLYYDGSDWVTAFRDGGAFHIFGNGVILDDDGRVVAGEELDLANPPLTYDHRHIGARTGETVPVNEYFGSLSSAIPSPDSRWPDYRRMANGVAFVIVSHGRNGNGATSQPPNRLPGAAVLVCRGQGGNRQENFNADRTSDCSIPISHPDFASLLPNQTYYIACSPCRTSGNGIFHVSNAGFSQSDAQSQPLNDDIVTWMNSSEMIIRLTEEQVLPLPLSPVALIVEN